MLLGIKMRVDKKITIAMSSWVAKNLHEAINIAKVNAFDGIEWDTNYIPISISPDDLRSMKKLILKSCVRLRFHAHNMDVEISHKNRFLRQTSLNFLKLYVNLIEKIGGDYLVVHAGYPSKECKIEHAIESLKNLVEYGREHGVTISLENTPQGFTSDPFCFLELLQKTEAQATFDIGHSNVSNWVKYKKRGSVDFLRLIKKHVTHAHVYFIENREHVHLPPSNIKEIRPVLDELLDANCNWWTIELADIKHLIKIKKILTEYLG